MRHLILAAENYKEIEGYNLNHTPSETHFGGVALYVKKSFDIKPRNDLSRSLKGVGESIFIEIERDRAKNIIIGCIFNLYPFCCLSILGATSFYI